MGPGAVKKSNNARKGSLRSNRPESVMAGKNQSKVQRLQFPVVPLSPHGIQFIFKDYDFNAFVVQEAGRRGSRDATAFYGTGEGDKKVAVKSNLVIDLPFPTTLTDATGLSINGFERELIQAVIGESITNLFSKASQPGGAAEAQGVIGSMAEDLQKVGGTLQEAYKEGGVKGVAGKISEQLAATLKIGTSSAKLLGSYLARNLPGDLSKTLAMDSGMAVNPSETLSFEGVNLKQYTFEWDLYPSSKEDSSRIKALVNGIKQRILPTTTGAGMAQTLAEISGDPSATTGAILGRTFLTYPDTVITNLIGVDESHFPLFKPAMCVSCDVDYGPGGNVVIAKGGRPSGIKLSMTFQELVIHSAEDYGAEERTFEGAEFEFKKVEEEDVKEDSQENQPKKTPSSNYGGKRSFDIDDTFGGGVGGPFNQQ